MRQELCSCDEEVQVASGWVKRGGVSQVTW